MTRTLTAVNTAPDSENRMHGDDARTYGFEGGLVPGVDVLAYMVDAALARWGSGWLEGGRLVGRLLQPVYDGETVDVTTESTEGETVAFVVGRDGRVRADAHLTFLDGEQRARVLAAADPAMFAVAPRPAPDQRPPASRALLEPGTVLATQVAGFHADRAVGYLDEISETNEVFRGVAHPGWLLRFANWALSQTVRLGPWIHVSSDLSLFAPVRDGDELEVRARVTDRFERKGHEFVDLLASYAVAGEVVALCDHRAIWQPRPRA
jgi:acyl dehydratase